jgi:tRNA threonylcarbamoyladenosine biosynthesis protein TsaB
MARLLALETATEACSVALLVDGQLLERFAVEPRRHAALLLPFVEQLLDEAGLSLTRLDAIAFGRGPGSFTGLRVAAGVAQGLAFGADLPVVPVSTLAALAQGVMRERHARCVLAALDARMGEVYWAGYCSDGDGLAQLLGEERVSRPERVELAAEQRQWHGAGSGWATYGELLARRCGLPVERVEAARLPRAGDTARLAAALFARGQSVPAAQALPVYLRDKVAEKPGGAT